MKNGLKNIKNEQEIEGLLMKYEQKVSTKNLSIMEQSIHDRGVSSGYFGIYIEELYDLTNRNQILYLEGQLKGEKRRRKVVKTFTEKQKKTYIESRKAYLRNLGSLKAKGVIKTDTSLLKPSELTHFNEGYNVEESLSFGKTLDDVFEEMNRHRKVTADEVLESKRSRVKSI